MIDANGQTPLGKFGAFLGGIGRAFYIFWNAGMQSMFNNARQPIYHLIKYLVKAGAMYALGYIVPILAELTGGGDGDDDDKNAYYNLPEYKHRSNICIRLGDQCKTLKTSNAKQRRVTQCRHHCRPYIF